MQKTIKLLVGCPASGKSTYAKNYCNKLKEIGKTYSYISRDEIRFSLVNEDEEYFSKEKEVFRKFINNIQEAINKGIDVIIVDATHITRASRKKVLRELALCGYRLDLIVFTAELEILLERNAERRGRARVPDSAIINMYNSFEHPNFVEFQPYATSKIAIIYKGAK